MKYQVSYTGVHIYVINTVMQYESLLIHLVCHVPVSSRAA